MAHGNPGVFHTSVGDVTVTALNDAMFTASTDFLKNISGADADALLAENFRAIPPRITVNAFLVRAQGRTILIDTGLGAQMGEGGGAMFRNLAAMGVACESVDTILMTHFHVDHIGGLTGADGKPLFPNADLITHAAEAAFWLDETPAPDRPEQLQQAFSLVARMVGPYRSRLRTVDGGAVAPGIMIEYLPGHTPGHSGFTIASGDEKLLVWGDVIHMPALQFARPEIGLVFDSDPDLARKSRERILAEAAATRLRVAGMHLDFPCFCHVKASGSGYAFVPEVWSP
jgi:glyoxylase-like metal-dependent hydrolase (beta-lactamase superfamily II)